MDVTTLSTFLRPILAVASVWNTEKLVTCISFKDVEILGMLFSLWGANWHCSSRPLKQSNFERISFEALILWMNLFAEDSVSQPLLRGGAPFTFITFMLQKIPMNEQDLMGDYICPSFWWAQDLDHNFFFSVLSCYQKNTVDNWKLNFYF